MGERPGRVKVVHLVTRLDFGGAQQNTLHTVAALDRSPCPCGRTIRRIRRIGRRSDDMFIIRGVNVFPSQVEEALLRVEGTAPHYLIELSRPGTLDEAVAAGAWGFTTTASRQHIGHGGKSNLVRLNGKPLLSTEVLGDGSNVLFTRDFDGVLGTTFDRVLIGDPFSGIRIQQTNAGLIPEPATAALGLMSMGMLALRRRRNA